MKTKTKTDYGQCTEKEPYESGLWASYQRPRCPRPATAYDGLCGPHRTGQKRSDAARARYEAEAAQHRRERAQADYAKSWRAEHPEQVWATPWLCPLCLYTVQETVAQAGMRLQWLINDHQLMHGQSWTAYQEAAGQGAERRETEG